MNGCLPRELLSALADGECEPDERRYAHEHLQDCLACRRAALEFASVQVLVAGLPPLVAPEAFVADVLGPGGVARRFGRAALRGPRRYVAASAVVAGVLVSVAGVAAPPEPEAAPVEMLMTRHVVVHDGSQVGGQVLFAVNNR